jgi:hypothetical protein
MNVFSHAAVQSRHVYARQAAATAMPDVFSAAIEDLSFYVDTSLCNHSLCSITINPMIPNMTVFNHGCSLSMIVTYPTAGT